MSHLNDIIERKINRLDTVPNALYSSVDRSQKQILVDTLKLIDSLDVVGGKYVLSNENLIKVEQITEALNKAIFQTEYRTAILTFAGEFQVQANINLEYFSEVFGSAITDKQIYQASLQASQKVALDILNESSVDAVFTKPLKEMLINGIASEANTSDVVQELTNYILGDEELEGQLLRYVKQVARDRYSIADRSYTDIIAQDLNMNYVLYSGGLVKDSRLFCQARVGQYYHVDEVSLWVTDIPSPANPFPHGAQWQGRFRGTNASNISLVLGGYNCLHSLLPVTEAQVPLSVIARNK